MPENEEQIGEYDYEDECDPWCKICNPQLEDDLLYENLDNG